VSVTVANSCQWTAVVDVGWITIASGASGTGSGEVRYTVAANATTSNRQGSITIGNRILTITQAGQPGSVCAFSIQPSTRSVAAAGGTDTVSITTAAGCSWTASSNAQWITLNGSTSGSGSASLSYLVAANTGAARTGTITIAGQTLTVAQAAACAFTIAPTSQSIVTAGGSGTVAVTAAAGCTWTAVSNATWVSITSGASGAGNGSVTFSVATNSGAARTGTLTIAGQTFTISQAALTCNLSLSPTSANFSASGGTGPVSVAVAAGCTWTAVSNNSWATVTSGASGNGAGTVSYSVASNATGSNRNGTLTIGGQTLSIHQTK